MYFRPSAPCRADQAYLLKRAQMSGDGLSCEGHNMVLDQASAELKQALIISLSQLFKNQQAPIVTQGAKQSAEVLIKRNTHNELCNIYVACQSRRPAVADAASG